MRRAQAFSTVNWRKYLDVNTNPRAKAFLESRGDDVLWQIASEIHRTMMTPDVNELIILVHPNAGAVIKIETKDFAELLQICLLWFQSKENYETCGKINTFMKRLDSPKPKKLKKTKETII